MAARGAKGSRLESAVTGLLAREDATKGLPVYAAAAAGGGGAGVLRGETAEMLAR